MNRDDIIRMAREAGGYVDVVSTASWRLTFFDGAAGVERFAALVAAAEREACAKVCEEEVCACCWNDEAQAAAEHLAEQIRARSNQCPS